MPEVLKQYKNELIKQIKTIEDKDVIDEIHRLLDLNVDDSIFITSTQQKKEIELARQQIKNKEGISSEQADREIDEWLEK